MFYSWFYHHYIAPGYCFFGGNNLSKSKMTNINGRQIPQRPHTQPNPKRQLHTMVWLYVFAPIVQRRCFRNCFMNYGSSHIATWIMIMVSFNQTMAVSSIVTRHLTLAAWFNDLAIQPWTMCMSTCNEQIETKFQSNVWILHTIQVSNHHN